MEEKDVNYWSILRKYGFKEIILSSDTLIFILIAILVFCLIPYIPIENKREFIKQYATIIISVSTAILAIVIGALAIIISMINDKFLKLIHDTDSYYDFVVPFFLCSIIWISSLVINLIIYMLVYFTLKSSIFIFILRITISISLGFVMCGLKGTCDLIITSIGLGEYRNKLISKEQLKDK